MTISVQPEAVETDRLLREQNELQALETSQRPAFLWAEDGGTLLWANEAAARFSGFGSIGDLFEVRFSGTSLAAQLDTIRRGLRPGLPRTELLRMPAKNRNLAFVARVSSLRANGQAGLLVVGPESRSPQQSAPLAPPKSAIHDIAIKDIAAFAHPAEETPKAVKKATAKQELSQKKKKDKTKTEKKKTKQAKAEISPIPVAKKATVAGKLEPHEHESLRTIALLLSGEGKDADTNDNNESATRPEMEIGSKAVEEKLAPAAGSIAENLQADLQRAQHRIESLEAKNKGLQNELHKTHIVAAELQTILDTASDGILILDGDGDILNMNRPAEVLFGRNLDALEGQNLLDLLAPESQEKALTCLQKFESEGLARVMSEGCEVFGLEARGEKIPLFMTLGSLGGQDAGLSFCAVLRDITQWKQAEAELTGAKKRAEAASEQKSGFLAKISHEIRTPLNAIIGFSEVMLEERFGPVGTERYKQYLSDIRNSGGHLLSLVNDLLDLSKIESGKLDLIFSATHLNDLVLQIIGLMQPQANGKGVIVRTSLQPTPPVAADPRSIRQILLNLLSNAIRFTPEGGQIIVSTFTGSGGSVALRVRDTGIGMSSSDISLALEPFRQIKSENETAKEEGTGLGLPISKALVEANHALFEIESTPQKGTLIGITFPPSRVLGNPF